MTEWLLSAGCSQKTFLRVTFKMNIKRQRPEEEYVNRVHGQC